MRCRRCGRSTAKALYYPVVIPKTIYGTDQDVTVVGIANLLVVSETMPDALAYDITRLLFEKQADLVAIHPQARDLTLSTATQGSPVPFHPGRHQVLHRTERLEALGARQARDRGACARQRPDNRGDRKRGPGAARQRADRNPDDRAGAGAVAVRALLGRRRSSSRRSTASPSCSSRSSSSSCCSGAVRRARASPGSTGRSSRSSVVALSWPIYDFDQFVYRAANPQAIDVALGIVTLVLILEAARRTVGLILPVTALVFLAYGYYGPLLDRLGLSLVGAPRLPDRAARRDACT